MALADRELKSQRTKLLATSQALERQVAEQRAAIQQANDEYQRALDTIDSNNIDNEAAIQAITIEHRQTLARVESMYKTSSDRQLIELQRLSDTYMATMDTLRSEHNTLMEKHSACQASNNVNTDKINAMAGELRECSARRDKMMATQKKLTTRVNELTSRIATLEAEYAAVQADNAALQTAKTTVMSQLAKQCRDRR